jgi:hypothetical protein
VPPGDNAAVARLGLEAFNRRDELFDRFVLAEMRGKLSGAEVPWRLLQLLELREGKFIRFDWFNERDEAIAAAEARRAS